MRQTFGVKCWRILMLLGAFCSLSVTSVFAESLDNLYRQSVIVASQSEAARNIAASKALKMVLVRASGRSELKGDIVKRALTKPQRFIESFHYAAVKEGSSQIKIELTFSEEPVKGLLREAGLPIWADNRPSVLVWLATESHVLGRQAVGYSKIPEVAKSLHISAQNRGVPLILPLMDLRDQELLDADQIWSVDEKAIAQASQRYTVDAVLVGRYRQFDKGMWLGDWTLMHRGQHYSFRTEGAALKGLLSAGIDTTASYLADIYAVVASAEDAESLVIEVAGIEDFQRYISVSKYLNDLTVLNSVDLLGLEGQTAVFKVQTEGRASLLFDALALDKQLVAESVTRLPISVAPSGVAPSNLVPAPAGSRENPLRFYWVR